MEAVPKLPMLSFELKISPVCPDFAAPFKRFIMKYYGEDADQYDREIIELEALRNNVCRTSRDFTGCSLLKRYYAQIYSLYNRFAAFENQIGVQCVWADIYTGQTNIGDLDFELSCILYNIGALHAELGATDVRQTAEEMKVSCTHFQCAAWAFQHLMENDKLFRSSDLSNDVLAFFVQIMLAQAQECILEKSMLDNRKVTIVAKVAAQVVEYYKSAISMLQQGAMNTSSTSSIIEVIGSKLFKEWKKFVEFKLTYYGAITHLYMGNMSEEQQKMGDRVAWFDSADTKMKEASKLAKQLDSHVNLKVTEAINFVADVITVKLTNAKKENDFIYHEKVSPVEALTEIKGASLVKGIPFSITDPEICGHDIFARLVPIEAHETASLYSAQKDEILRQIRRKVDESNQELVAYLSSLQLDKETLRAPKEEPVSDELVEICAELSLNPHAVDEVEKTLARLDSICEETQKAIEASKQLLKDEEVKEKEHHTKFGKRPPSLILVELSKELTKHEETHNKAMQSNRSLWENFDQHKDDVIIMASSSASKIASILPSTKNISFDEETVNEMERLFDKVEEMKNQRLMLEDKLVKEMDSDNVLKLVLAHSKSEIDGIFEREIKKYDQIVSLIEQNLTAQNNILRALTNCNARYVSTRKAMIEIQRSRKTRVASLLYTYQVFKELQTNSKKGLEFYEKFHTIITRHNARLGGVIKVQDEERTQFGNVQTKKLAPPLSMDSPMIPKFGHPSVSSMAPSPSNSTVSSMIPPISSQAFPQMTHNLPQSVSPIISQTVPQSVPQMVPQFQNQEQIHYMNQLKKLPTSMPMIPPMVSKMAPTVSSMMHQTVPQFQNGSQTVSSMTSPMVSHTNTQIFPQSMSHMMSQHVPQMQMVPHSVPQSISQGIPQSMSQMNPTSMPQMSSQSMPQMVPQSVPQMISQQIPQMSQQTVPQYQNGTQMVPQYQTGAQMIPQYQNGTTSQIVPQYQNGPQMMPQYQNGTNSQMVPQYQNGSQMMPQYQNGANSQMIPPMVSGGYPAPYSGYGNVTNTQQQQYMQQPVSNSVPSIVQVLETESKGGWPVLAPTKSAEDDTATVIPSPNVIAPSAVQPNVEPSKEQKPDVLSQFDPLFS